MALQKAVWMERNRVFKSKNLSSYIPPGIKRIPKNRYFHSSLVALGFCVASFVVLYVGSAPSISQLKEGDISLRTIYAPYDFTYPTTIDEEKTENVRREFEERIPPVYDIDGTIQDKTFAKLDAFFNSLKEVREIPAITKKGMIDALRTKTAFVVADKELSKFVESKEPELLRKISKDALEKLFLVGIMGIKDKTELLSQGKEKISIRNPNFKIERVLKTEELVDEKEAKKIASDMLGSLIPQDRFMKGAILSLIKGELVKNTRFNEEETGARKAKARDSVSPIYKREMVRKNELITEKGKGLTKDDIVKLTQITRVEAIVNRAAYLSGLFILLLGLVISATIYLVLFEKKLIQTPKYILLIGINSFLAILTSLVVIYFQKPPYFIPLAACGMILVLLLNAHAGFIASLCLSVYIGFMAGGKLSLTLVLFIGSVVGIYVAQGSRRRSQILFAGFCVSLMNFLSIAGIGLLNNVEKDIILREGFYGIANGLFSSFIVIGFLPVFEYAFNLITNITLLELSDLSSPLLKELTIKAPGTYHHSMLVGNLAEEASDAIEANSLLARVGAYYHDIGKIEKPGYFVENEMSTVSKHKRLVPSMSALIITNHTRDGIELAKKHKLNKSIIDFISQHHGTGLIYYFYHKALEKGSPEEELKEEEFRYPGPKPQTKEVAIVLLADSVEASSRMLTDPTPARIRGLVQKIINNKFIDGQLDECELTLRDLNKIAESFIRVLTGVFHARLEYPPEATHKKERNHDFADKDKQSK